MLPSSQNPPATPAAHGRVPPSRPTDMFISRRFLRFAASVAAVVAAVGSIRGVAAEPQRMNAWDTSTSRLLAALEERQMPDVVLWVL